MGGRRFSLAFLLVAAVLAGCGSYPKKVDCEGHLRAINAPAPAPSKEAQP